MNSKKENDAYQSMVDENKKNSYQKQRTNKEKCENSQELSINENTQSKSTKGIVGIG